jgi:plastocyanin
MRLGRALRIAAIVLCGGVWLAAPAVATSQSVVIQNFSFQPQDVTINIGESVTWINHDPVGHTATSDSQGLFDTGVIAPAGNKTVSFAIAGTYAYHCSIHPSLKGTVTVVGPTPTPGPSTPAPSPTASPSGTPPPSPTVAPSGTRITVPTNVAAASPGPSSGAVGPDLGAGPGPILAAGGLALAAALAVLAIALYRRR